MKKSGKSNMKQKVWVVVGNSESGDDFGPVVFKDKPTDEKLKELCFNWDGDEKECGPGMYGSYVYLDVSCCEVE